MNKLIHFLFFTFISVFTLKSQGSYKTIFEGKMYGIKDINGNKEYVKVKYDTSCSKTPLFFDSIERANIKIDFSEAEFKAFHYLDEEKIKLDNKKQIQFFKQAYNYGYKNKNLKFDTTSDYTILIKPKEIVRKGMNNIVMPNYTAVFFNLYLIKNNDTLIKMIFDPIIGSGAPLVTSYLEFRTTMTALGRGIYFSRRKFKKGLVKK